MEQLIMYWKNNGQKAERPIPPADCEIITFDRLPHAVDHWLDIMQYGLSDGLQDERFYRDCMKPYPAYREDHTFFLVEKGNPVASITLICDDKTKDAYVHMVACKPECRGKGYGGLLNQIALWVFTKEGMETAHLTTDDWRIPAIKSYLRAGFYPDRSTEDFQRRWDDILKITDR